MSINGIDATRDETPMRTMTMATKKTATTKHTTKRTKAKKPTPKTETAKETQADSKPEKTPATRKLSAIDAAAKVLGQTKTPMSAKALIDAMAEKDLWTSPGGKTPQNTLHAAIMREINTKGDESRFAKVGRGQFGLAGK